MIKRTSKRFARTFENLDPLGLQLQSTLVCGIASESSDSVRRRRAVRCRSQKCLDNGDALSTSCAEDENDLAHVCCTEKWVDDGRGSVEVMLSVQLTDSLLYAGAIIHNVENKLRDVTTELGPKQTTQTRVGDPGADDQYTHTYTHPNLGRHPRMVHELK